MFTYTKSQNYRRVIFVACSFTDYRLCWNRDEEEERTEQFIKRWTDLTTNRNEEKQIENLHCNVHTTINLSIGFQFQKSIANCQFIHEIFYIFFCVHRWQNVYKWICFRFLFSFKKQSAGCRLQSRNLYRIENAYSIPLRWYRFIYIHFNYVHFMVLTIFRCFLLLLPVFGFV